MKLAANIVYRDLEASPALSATIEKKLDKLARLSDRLAVQRVVVTAPHQHHHKGSAFHVSLEMQLHGKPINISHAEDKAPIAVREAFAAAERAIKAESGKQRAKRHVDKNDWLAPEAEPEDLDIAS
ncbi:HPF/RaiA family ribosome-associated protein [Simiduia aestuariiviva]|uniref:Ribosome-associated translation inhibitor RaiA n=1 Tax=Simiduia aestuariiviva TaxID=1510459 RepID=A0A839UKB7_9GAMM|nr:HPF/RaiA family ribosome-associated protein [Simiduia aestuariiviva]MBB3168073.1 ribosome-associated translation inhibitor RaiA [Simiduia aestuariiviva]